MSFSISASLSEQDEQALEQAFMQYKVSMNSSESGLPVIQDQNFEKKSSSAPASVPVLEQNSPYVSNLHDTPQSPGPLHSLSTDAFLAGYESDDDVNSDYSSQYVMPKNIYAELPVDNAERKLQEANTAIEQYKTNLRPQQKTPGKVQQKTQKTPIRVSAPTPVKPKIVQSDDDKTVIAFGGYIKPEAYWDTRQIINERDGEFLFYPAPLFADPLGDDINANGEFDMIAIQTRLNLKVTGPRLNRTTQISGFIEGDFFGTDDTSINGFHMRHAMTKIVHRNSTFLFGYYWHPMLVEECNPLDVISFNQGAPFESYTRNPQMRFEQKFSNFRLIVAALSEVDFRSTGTLGPSTTYLRDAIVPILHAQIQAAIGEHVVGGGVDFRRLKPRLASSTNFKVDEHVNSVSGIAYAALNFKNNIQVKAKFIYASNDFSYAMIGGYGITSVNPVTEAQTYAPIRNLSTWFELSGGNVFVPGIFIGYLKNIGASSLLAPIDSVPGAQSFGDLIYGRGINIDWALRVSPRIVWNVKNLQVCAELETTHAQYGTILQDAKVCPNDPETNVRLLLATFYYF